MNEPEEVTAARRIVDEYQRERYAERQAEEEQKRLAWVAAHVGRRYEVDIDGVERWSSDGSHRVTFTARLLEADRQEGRMVWDNGVVTEGVGVSGPLSEPMSPVTASREEGK